MNERRTKLAWLTLLGSFAICVTLAVFVPFGIRTIIQNARRNLLVTIQANQGTVGILDTDSNESRAIFSGDLPQEITIGSTILTNAADTALLLISEPDDENLLARIQVYGNANVTVSQASTPRFSGSPAAHSTSIFVTSGRTRITILPTSDREIDVNVFVPQGQINIVEPGFYSVLVGNVETQFTVLEGSAMVAANSQDLELAQDQRVVLLSDGSLMGPADTERNLVKNGDFGQGLSDWVALAPNIELVDQPTVNTNVVERAGAWRIEFNRLGIGHADSGLRQIVNADVSDFDSLKLIISMRITSQSLGVCGQQGSECPVTVRLEYEDVNGVTQTWQQGFFSLGEVTAATPDVCVACPPPLNEHQRVPFNQLVFFESGNLLDILGPMGILPRQVKTVSLIASGHTFTVEVVEVALLAEE